MPTNMLMGLVKSVAVRVESVHGPMPNVVTTVQRLAAAKPWTGTLKTNLAGFTRKIANWLLHLERWRLSIRKSAVEVEVKVKAKAKSKVSNI